MRKSVLLAGSALAVAGLTVGAQKAEAAEISLGMYMPFIIGGADSDNNNESQLGLGTTDTEFYVTGTTTLENGISVAVKFQFNADGDTATTNTDETEIEISGSFGLISLGHEDGPADLMNLGATKVKAWAFGSFANTTGVPVAYTQYSGAATSNEAGLDTGDAVKIAYYTPRWSGFQFGIAWANSTEISGQTRRTNRNGYEAGINYQNTFGDVGVALAGSVFWANQPDNNPLFVFPDVNVDDSHRWSLGAKFDYMGFSLAGQFSEGQRATGQDVQTYDIGIGYSTGPWAMHLVYEHGEADAHVTMAPVAGAVVQPSGDAQMVHAGVSYALGSGVSLGASIGFGEDDSDFGAQKDYTTFTTGIVVSF